MVLDDGTCVEDERTLNTEELRARLRPLLLGPPPTGSVATSLKSGAGGSRGSGGGDRRGRGSSGAAGRHPSLRALPRERPDGAVAASEEPIPRVLPDGTLSVLDAPVFSDNFANAGAAGGEAGARPGGWEGTDAALPSDASRRAKSRFGPPQRALRENVTLQQLREQLGDGFTPSVNNSGGRQNIVNSGGVSSLLATKWRALFSVTILSVFLNAKRISSFLRFFVQRCAWVG